MINSMRQPTLETLGLGSVLEIFQLGKLPANTAELVYLIFGNSANRGSLALAYKSTK